MQRSTAESTIFVSHFTFRSSDRHAGVEPCRTAHTGIVKVFLHISSSSQNNNIADDSKAFVLPLSISYYNYISS